VKKLTICIRRDAGAALEEMGQRFVEAWRTGKSSGDTLQFGSPAALFRVLTPKRWELVERLQQLGPSSVRGLARALGRDVKRVHEDVGELMVCGIVARRENGQIEVPYALIHAEFDLDRVA
jgi:predicted transcriptional regulator